MFRKSVARFAKIEPFTCTVLSSLTRFCSGTLFDNPSENDLTHRGLLKEEGRVAFSSSLESGPEEKLIKKAIANRYKSAVCKQHVLDSISGRLIGPRAWLRLVKIGHIIEPRHRF
jgi:hypothetical protein